MEDYVYLAISFMLLIYVLASNTIKHKNLWYFHESTFSILLGLMLGCGAYFLSSDK